jgi:hypothetical protein
MENLCCTREYRHLNSVTRKATPQPVSKYPECPHDVNPKWLTTHGLVCENCLTNDDFKRYPKWRQMLEESKRKRDQAYKNFKYKEIK